MSPEASQRTDASQSVAVFLGAGFSAPVGVPLASTLFGVHFEVDRFVRQNLMERVLSRWQRWREATDGTPEEYLSYAESQGGLIKADAVRYVGLVIALSLGKVREVGGRLTITGHNLTKTTGDPVFEMFWSSIFRHTERVSVVTTNYDIIAERGLRHVPRPRVLRPGFHYGDGPEDLAGGGFPSFSYLKNVSACGKVPLFKLHGSVSWAVERGTLVKYFDCRPGIRGDAAIVAPIIEKKIPTYLEGIWKGAAKHLSQSSIWIVVGYSLPSYDLAVQNLLCHNGMHNPTVHVFDPDLNVARKFAELLPRSPIVAHFGLPAALQDVDMLFEPGGISSAVTTTLTET